MTDKHMVLKPIVYRGKDQIDESPVLPGAVLDFSYLSQEELNSMYDNFTLGPPDKKAFDLRLKAIADEKKEIEKQAQEKAKANKKAAVMLELMKEQANLKEASK